jgi:hypothetical protein
MQVFVVGAAAVTDLAEVASALLGKEPVPCYCSMDLIANSLRSASEE